MAEKVLNAHFQLRHDIAENWTSADPVLLLGEVGIETDTNKMKVGDGESAWSELDYMGSDDAQITGLIAEAEDNVKVVVPNEGESDTEACSRVYESSESKGDMCVVKHLINGEIYSHTAYVYDGSAWKAMDGNYNAENVYFAEDIDITTKVGLIQTLVNGKATWECGGKNIKQAMQALFAKEEQPTVTAPGAKYSTYTLSKSAGDYEAGTLISGTVNYTLALNGSGSYTYGPAVAGVSESGTYSLAYSCDKTTGAAETGTKDTKSGSFDYEFYVGDNTKHVKITSASVGYTDASNYANTNLGNATTKKVTAGNANPGTKDEQFKGFRYWYIGGLNDEETLTSAKIKGLTAKKSGSGLSGTNDFNAASYNSGNIKRMIVAIPASASKTVKSVLLKSASNADITGEFKEQTQVSVEGASDGYATNYRVWEYKPASLDSTEVYTITVG